MSCISRARNVSTPQVNAMEGPNFVCVERNFCKKLATPSGLLWITRSVNISCFTSAALSPWWRNKNLSRSDTSDSVTHVHTSMPVHARACGTRTAHR